MQHHSPLGPGHRINPVNAKECSARTCDKHPVSKLDRWMLLGGATLAYRWRDCQWLAGVGLVAIIPRYAPAWLARARPSHNPLFLNLL